VNLNRPEGERMSSTSSASAPDRRSFLARSAAVAAVPAVAAPAGGALAAADVYTASTTFVILESIRLDLGIDSQVHA
jgi:hypothetical protein